MITSRAAVRSIAAGCVFAAAAACSGSGGTHSSSSTSSRSTSPSASPISADPAALVEAAGAKTTTGSARIAMDVSTTIAGAASPMHLTGTGVMSFTQSEGSFDFQTSGGTLPQAVHGAEIITPTAVYVQPQVPELGGKWVKIDLSALTGGPGVGQIADPGAVLAVLHGASDAHRVGTEAVRGATTTHYAADVSVAQALARVPERLRSQVQAAFAGSNVQTIPIDVWVDSSGRVRRIREHVALNGPTTQNKQVVADTTIEYFDFGVPVSVSAPPPAQVVTSGNPLG